MTDTQQVDRRKWDRVPIAIPMFLSGTHEGKKYIEFGTAVNISAGGVLIAARRFLPPSARVVLEIPSAPLPESALSTAARTMSGRLLRVQAADNHNLLAIEFDQPLVAEMAKTGATLGN